MYVDTALSVPEDTPRILSYLKKHGIVHFRIALKTGTETGLTIALLPDRRMLIGRCQRGYIIVNSMDDIIALWDKNANGLHLGWGDAIGLVPFLETIYFEINHALFSMEPEAKRLSVFEFKEAPTPDEIKTLKENVTLFEIEEGANICVIKGVEIPVLRTADLNGNLRIIRETNGGIYVGMLGFGSWLCPETTLRQYVGNSYICEKMGLTMAVIDQFGEDFIDTLIKTLKRF